MKQSGMIPCGRNCKICLDNDAGSGDGNIFKIHWACNRNSRVPENCRIGDDTGSAGLPDWLPSHGTVDVPDKIKDCVKEKTKWLEKAQKVSVPVPNTKCCRDVEFKTFEPTFPTLPNVAPQPETVLIQVVTCFGLALLIVAFSPIGM